LLNAVKWCDSLFLPFSLLKKKTIAGLFYEQYFSVEALGDTKNSKLNKMKRPSTKQLYAGHGLRDICINN